MGNSPIKFGTSGWRGLIADDFTFANVRLAVTAIAEHAKAKAKEPTILVGYDTRFYSEEFSQLAVDILQHHGIRTLLCETFTPHQRSLSKSCAAHSTAPSTSPPATIPRNI